MGPALVLSRTERGKGESMAAHPEALEARADYRVPGGRSSARLLRRGSGHASRASELVTSSVGLVSLVYGPSWFGRVGGCFVPQHDSYRGYGPCPLPRGLAGRGLSNTITSSQGERARRVAAGVAELISLPVGTFGGLGEAQWNEANAGLQTSTTLVTSDPLETKDAQRLSWASGSNEVGAATGGL